MYTPPYRKMRTADTESAGANVLYRYRFCQTRLLIVMSNNIYI